MSAIVENINANKPLTRLMIDVETLGLNLMAPIVQIGAVPFDFFDDQLVIGSDIFDSYCNPFEQAYSHGFAIDYSTISWWMRVDSEIQQKVFPENTDNVAPIHEVIIEFKKYLKQLNPKYVYARGPQFDLRLIEYADRLTSQYMADIMGETLTFNWYAVIDVRSMTHGLDSEMLDSIASSDNLHNAVNDCISQIKQVEWHRNVIRDFLDNYPQVKSPFAKSNAVILDDVVDFDDDRFEP